MNINCFRKEKKKRLMSEIPTKYDFQDNESRIYDSWEKKGFFHAKVNPGGKPFVIVIPPPNVTGILHMGHALNDTIQDILVRYHKMIGEETLWMPGTDHAGIATQNVVERKLGREGLRRQDLGREKFLEQVWLWKEQHGSTIIRQLKRLGCACDWERTRFTMDEGYSEAVQEVFIRLHQKGLIYRGNYIINWCPRCQTALSDEEAPHQDSSGFLYYIRYPLEDGSGSLTVATTRPETMLGDTAVAVNPRDERYKKFIGKRIILPFLDRLIPVIADDFVDPEFGTGAVKVTPAHDPNDYGMGRRHDLPFINILHPDGRMNENAGDYAGMDRFEAREALVEALRERGLLEKIVSHDHAVGHCYRCNTVIEPYLSKQWFVRMKPLAGPAVTAVKDGRIKFHPERWEKVYLNWMENIQDWCISRQIWWGHRLPVYYCPRCQSKDGEAGVTVARQKPEKCPVCGSAEIVQDNDVLDTWFSSWLWPFATFGWPRPEADSELKYFYPTSVLVTAQEIIFFWVARMIMAGLEFMNDIPFSDVYIHGTVRDKTGKKMSKSLGNVIDPLEIIDDFGADALRISLISLTSMGQDVYLSRDKFEYGRNFANKIWNAARFIQMNLDVDHLPADPLAGFSDFAEMPLAERWIISRFYSVEAEVRRSLERFRFNEAAGLLYDFFWHQFCDWYLELAKLSISENHTQQTLYRILSGSLLLLHPFMPFLTEELWTRLCPSAGSLMTHPWPAALPGVIDRELEGEMGLIITVCGTMRNLRSRKGLSPRVKVKVRIFVDEAGKRRILENNIEYVKYLVNAEEISFSEENQPPSPSVVSDVISGCSIFLDAGGEINKAEEEAKINKRIAELEEAIRRKEQLLNNPRFREKAPPEVVEKESAGKKELVEEREKLEQVKNALSR